MATRSSAPTKTLRFRLLHRNRALPWFESTKRLFNYMIKFYFTVLEAHQDLLELSSQEALRALELLTHATSSNSDPPCPLFSFDIVIPALFRRAAISAAIGAAQSFHTRLEAWKKLKKAKGSRFHTKPPVPPRTWNYSPVFYAGQWKEFDGCSTLRLKLWSGTSWCWVKFKLRGRGIPKNWKALSPSLVRAGRTWNLHVPIIKTKFKYPKKIVDQFRADPDLKICAVDLNISSSLAVCVITRSDGTVEATRFITGGRYLQSRRKRILGIIATKRALTGIITRGEQDNVKLWEKIGAIDTNSAHQVSARIVEFAGEHGAKVLVFEHLGNFRPKKGRYSARGNEKRSYWLRGKIFHYAKYKAWACGILTSRVNPAYTSQLCHVCQAKVYRFDVEPSHTDPYTPGAPNWLCSRCEAGGNADLNAAEMVGWKFFQRELSKPRWKHRGVPGTQDGPGHGSPNRRGTSGEVLRPLRSTGCGYATHTRGYANARAS